MRGRQRVSCLVFHTGVAGNVKFKLGKAETLVCPSASVLGHGEAP